MSYSANVHTPARYSHEVFQSLELLEVVYEKAQQRKNTIQEVQKDLRNIFTKHGVAQVLGLGLIHRHFDMLPNEMLVEYGKVATPWPVLPANATSLYGISEYPPFVHGGQLVPRCWKLHKEGLIPTEFGFNPYVDAGPGTRYSEVEFQTNFVSELQLLLKQNNLLDIFGLVALDHTDLEGFPRLEKTMGRVSITIPLPKPPSHAMLQGLPHSTSSVSPGEELEVDPFCTSTGADKDVMVEQREQGNEEKRAIDDELLKNGFEAVWTFGCHERMSNSTLLPQVARVCWVCGGCK